ncbi:MAG: ribosome small subunit-dependent GTPase A [Spirochaetales bacterium]|nr:ribosome small subunit-dependent GTPase A [Spirochaetales bacterium]
MSGSLLTGTVLFGMNNIYTVEVDGRQLQCRIKGKVLQTERTEYNPIAVGDRVTLRQDAYSDGTGWIAGREPRRSLLSRWNKKRQSVQAIAANADLLVGVSSFQSPPFRPRFLDRLLVSAEASKLEPLIVVNKSDLPSEPAAEKRLAEYRRIGYRVLRCSARTGAGVGQLKEALRGRVAVFFGQSGVGKSSILNRIAPGLSLPVGEVSQKHNRGSHTTSFARMFRLEGGLTVIDTPGIRELEIADVEPEELPFLFREFAELAPRCLYTGCQHLDEPGCAVRQAVEAGSIHHDRYESYLRIYADLKSFYEARHGSPYP